MSDLASKFSELESQLATQHTEIGLKIDALLEALGVPPPTATTTLTDISVQLGSLNDSLEQIITDNTAYYASSLDLLGLLNTSLDTIINNNSLNAQRTIAAIYATFCECGSESPLLGPPLDVTPSIVVDEAKCRRIQFYLSVFGNWLDQIANYGASGATITGGTLSALLSIVIADAGIVATGVEVGAAGGIPGIVVGAVVGIIAAAVFTLGGSILKDYANQFNDPTLRDNMVMAMYAAANADEGYSAFKTTLLAGMDTIPAEIIYTLWWSAWSNDVYSNSPTVDDSAFDGSICAPPIEGECPTYTAVDVGTHWMIHWSPGDTILEGDFIGYSSRLVSDYNPPNGTGELRLYLFQQESYGDPAFIPKIALNNTSQMIGIHTINLQCNAFKNGTAGQVYTIELCPPV